MQKEVFSSESETGVYEIYGYAADKYITEFTDCTLTPLAKTRSIIIRVIDVV